MLMPKPASFDVRAPDFPSYFLTDGKLCAVYQIWLLKGEQQSICREDNVLQLLRLTLCRFKKLSILTAACLPNTWFWTSLSSASLASSVQW